MYNSITKNRVYLLSICFNCDDIFLLYFLFIIIQESTNIMIVPSNMLPDFKGFTIFDDIYILLCTYLLIYIHE